MSYIETELQKFNITNSAIAELEQKFLPLKIDGLDDKEGYKQVKNARQIIKAKRIEVEKRRKELTADALAFQRSINAEAKRITALLEPIEAYLGQQEDAIDAEKEKIKVEKEQAEAARIQTRINAILELGFKFNGEHYHSDFMEMTISPFTIKLIHEDAFERDLSTIKAAYEQHQAKLAVAEQERQEQLKREQEAHQAELLRLEQVRQEQEAEGRRLAAIAKEQAEKEEAFKEHQRRIDAEKLKQDAEKTLAAQANESAELLMSHDHQESFKADRQLLIDFYHVILGGILSCSADPKLEMVSIEAEEIRHEAICNIKTILRRFQSNVKRLYVDEFVGEFNELPEE